MPSKRERGRRLPLQRSLGTLSLSHHCRKWQTALAAFAIDHRWCVSVGTLSSVYCALHSVSSLSLTVLTCIPASSSNTSSLKPIKLLMSFSF